MKKQRIVGVFDSGVGGLTVMKEIMAKMPDVRILYFGDTARVPYGNRTTEELIRFGDEIITFLVGQGAEAIVVACNTSSATALPALRDRFDIPMIGMIEPGARLAVERTRQGKIGLVATETTVRSRAYTSEVSRALARGVMPHNSRLHEAWHAGEQAIALVKAQACPLFVPLIEAGLADSEQARQIAETYVLPLQEAEIDSLILGCTHYPFLAPVLKDILGEQVELIDPALAVVEELARVVEEMGQEETEGFEREGRINWRARYFVSGDPVLFRQVGNTLLGEQIEEVQQVSWS